MDTILLVDDDVEILKTNSDYLKDLDYKVITTKSSLEAVEIFKNKKNEIKLIVLDVMLPEMDGFTLCKKLKRIKDIPVIFLTGKDSEDDKIEGLMLGGDDYITKPYSLRELAARIAVNIRKMNTDTKDNDEIIIDTLTINTRKHKVYYLEDEIDISNNEYDLLLLLAENINNTVTFEMIGKKLLGVYIENDRQSIMMKVSRLRRKLSHYSGLKNLIETVWSKGYIIRYNK